MKSLEKLRNLLAEHVCDHEWDDGKTQEIFDAADEIQAEVDKFYLPRPLFEDGELVRIGDRFMTDAGEADEVIEIGFAGLGYVLHGQYHSETRALCHMFKRPPEPDTQEKIYSDATLSPLDYADKRGLDVTRVASNTSEASQAMIFDLLERQRKVCEGKS